MLNASYQDEDEVGEVKRGDEARDAAKRKRETEPGAVRA
jgi:hypothetical protein